MNELIEAFKYPFTYFLLISMSYPFIYLNSYVFCRIHSKIFLKLGIGIAIVGFFIIMFFKNILGLSFFIPLYVYYITNYIENSFYKEYKEFPKDISFWYLKGEKKDHKNIKHQYRRGLLLLLIPMTFFFTLFILSLELEKKNLTRTNLKVGTMMFSTRPHLKPKLWCLLVASTLFST